MLSNGGGNERRLLPSQKRLGYIWRATVLSLSQPVVGDALFRYLTEFRARTQQYRYSAPAPPFETIEVAPAEIDWWNKSLLKGWGLGQIHGGDWDTEEHSRRLEENITRRGLRQRFVDDLPWDETEYVQRAAEQIDSDGSFWGYGSIEAFVDDRCAYVDELYERINTKGYVPESRHDVPETDVRQNAQKYRHSLEPFVSIGRDGRLFYVDGIHRFSIAEILDIEIPVHVLARHTQWQQVRDEIATTRESEQRTVEVHDKHSHPDLDVIE